MSQIANAVGGAIQGLTGKMTASGEEQASAWQKIGTGAMVAGGLMLAAAGGMAAIGFGAVEAASKFQRSMELIHTQAGASQAQVEQLSQAVLALAPAVGMGPDELAAGLYHIVSVGVPAAQAMDVLKVAAEGAKVGIADMETVTNALAATMVSNIKGVSGAADAMGQLNATIGAGNMRMQDMVGALSTGILPAAQNFGLSLRDVGSALATLTDLGTPAEEAATRLRMTFSMMGAPTGAAAKELKTIGISVTELGDIMRSQGLIPALQDLHNHLVDSGLTATQQADVLARAFGGGRSSAAILGLIQNLDRMNQKQQQIGATSGGFGESVAATTDTLGYKTAQLNAAWQSLQITLGTALIPVITQLVTAVTPILTQITTWISHNQKLVGTIAPLAVAGMALLGVLLLVVGAIMILASPITLIVLGIMLLVAVIVLAVTHWTQIHAVITAVWNTIKGFAATLVGDVVGAWNAVVAAVDNFISSVGNAIGGFFSGLGTDARNAWNAVTGAVTGFVATVTSAIGGFFSRLGTLASTAWQEFSSHPLYWIGYLLVFIPLKLGQLLARFIEWVAQMIAHALIWAGQMLAKANEMAVGFVEAVITEMVRLPVLVAMWLENVVVATVRWVNEMVARANEMAVHFVEAVIHEMFVLPGQVIELLERIVPMVVRWGLDLIDAGVKAWLDFSTATGREMDKLPQQAWDIGVAIVQGIIGGIQSMISWGEGQIGSFIQGLVQGAKDAAKSSSPSLLFAEEVGIPIAQGIALGIQRGALGARAVLAGSIVDLANPRGAPAYSLPPTAAATAASAGDSSLSSTTTIVLQMDSQVLATVIDRRIDQRLTRALTNT